MIDGVWSATWTYEGCRAARCQMSWTEVNPRKSSAGSATVQVDSDIIVLQTKRSEKFAMRWQLEGDPLTFVRDVSLDVGPSPFVIEPWIRQP